eukprot:gb/GECG01002997.1/.p1 GENE.gb/GECG01002997.1/~~gb/GECG01002997.1/.p1  ORF type:complete len:595 (+),score=72.80 gb/GECG01002997.1/:1-1785(+)
MEMIMLLKSTEALTTLQNEFSYYASLSDLSDPVPPLELPGQRTHIHAARTNSHNMNRSSSQSPPSGGDYEEGGNKDEEPGLSMAQFIFVMLKVLPEEATGCNFKTLHEMVKNKERPSGSWPKKTIDISISLVDLFAEIDMNGDGVLQWDEFTTYCIDAGGQAIKTEASPLLQKLEYDADFDDSAIRHNFVRSLNYMSYFDELWSIESECSQIKAINPNTFQLIGELDVLSHVGSAGDQSLVRPNKGSSGGTDKSRGKNSGEGDEVGSIDAQEEFLYKARLQQMGSVPTVTGVIYIPQHKLVAVSQSNNRISLWRPPATLATQIAQRVERSLLSLGDGSDSRNGLSSIMSDLTYVESLHTRGIITCMATTADLLFAASSTDTSIWVFDLTSKVLINRHECHTDGITCLQCVVPSMRGGTPWPQPHRLLVSSSLDRTIGMSSIHHPSIEGESGHSRRQQARARMQQKDSDEGKTGGAPNRRGVDTDTDSAHVLRLVKNMTGHKRSIQRIVWVPQAGLLFSSGYDTEVLGWDLEHGNLAMRMSGHSAPIIDLCMLPAQHMQQAKTTREPKKKSSSEEESSEDSSPPSEKKKRRKVKA